MYVCVQVLYPLELESQTLVSFQVCWDLNPGPLQEQQSVVLTSEPSLKPHIRLFLLMFWAGQEDLSWLERSRLCDQDLLRAGVVTTEGFDSGWGNCFRDVCLS